MMIPRYDVIFRTCDAVFSVHKTERPFGLTKQEVIKVCFLSLYRALEGLDFRIHILGDRLSEEMLEFFGRFPVEISNGEMGNSESIRQSVLKALEAGEEDWIYFCEDDYLHTEDAFRCIDELIRQRHAILAHEPKDRWARWAARGLAERPLFIHPPDYPDRYMSKKRKPSLIFMAPSRHWRQVSNTTFTFLTQGKSIRRYEKHLLQCAEGAKDGRLSRRLYAGLVFWKKGLCLSPIPGLATHMHSHVMSPQVDWEPVMKRNRDILRDRGLL